MFSVPDSTMLWGIDTDHSFSVLYAIPFYAYTIVYKSILFSIDEYLSCFDFYSINILIVCWQTHVRVLFLGIKLKVGLLDPYGMLVFSFIR